MLPISFTGAESFVYASSAPALTWDEGHNNGVYTHEIGFTDFPLNTITLYFTNNVIYLPSKLISQARSGAAGEGISRAGR
jgi:hypothetical protein